MDGLAVALAKLFSEHCRADVAFSGVRDYRKGVSRFSIIRSARVSFARAGLSLCGGRLALQQRPDVTDPTPDPAR
jgi:hypothetical protein